MKKRERYISDLRLIKEMTSKLLDIFTETRYIQTVNDGIAQYNQLFSNAVEIEPEIKKYVRKIEFGNSNYDVSEKTQELFLQASQLYTYISNKLLPLSVTLASELKKIGITTASDSPLKPLDPFLKKLDLSTSWVIGASLLCLMEIMVNKKLQQLDMDTGGTFKTRIDRLATGLKQINQKLPVMLPKTFYGLRGDIVHGGKEPTLKELETIIHFMNNFSNMI